MDGKPTASISASPAPSNGADLSALAQPYANKYHDAKPSDMTWLEFERLGGHVPYWAEHNMSATN
jgi:hypothetical protein